MESGGETMRRIPDMEWVMCSTCSSFVSRKKRTAIAKPDEEVVEVVTEAEKMRNLMKAVLLLGPLQEIEPVEATEEQWKVLQRRRIMMETKKCPACSSSLLEACPTCFRWLPNLNSTEEGNELMAVLPSQGGKERKKIATEDGVMVADARPEHKLKRSREEGKRSSSELKEKAKSGDKEGSGSKKKEKKKAKSGDKEGSGSKKKAKRSSEMEGGSEEANIEFIKSVGGDTKAKMVTERVYKKSIDFLKNQPPLKPPPCDLDYMYQQMVDITAPYVEVNRVLLEYLQCHYSIKGYAEVQLEVTDDEGDDHKLV